MTYEHVYVASVALHDQAQVLRAFVEADNYKGPSIIVAYAPCIQHQVRPQGLNDMINECRFAVESGYWPLYRFNPELEAEGKNPFILDSKKLRKEVSAFLKREGRFINLQKKHPEVAEELYQQQNREVHHRMEHMLQYAAGYKAFDNEEDASVRVLFASETGTAARLANDFAAACVLSHEASAMDDAEVDDLDGHTTVFFIATCGQGAMPRNGKYFYEELCKRTEPFKENTNFMIMGLGDSSYYFFNKAAKDVEAKLVELGANKMLPIGLGDDSDEEGFEQGLHEWLPLVWPALGTEPPKEVPHITPIKVQYSQRAILRTEEDIRAINQYYKSENIQAESVSILSNDLLCRKEYNRDFRNIKIQKNGNLDYELGDALEIFPCNDHDKVVEFIHQYTHDYDERTVVKIHSWGIDGEISIGYIFTYILDLFGKPSMHFMQQLATFETDEEERKTMLDIDFLKRSGKETGITVADALLRFKKAHPPLPALFAMIPTIKQRAYSIASTPRADGGAIELCVLIDTWWCDEGMRYGLTCDMLRKLQVNDTIWCKIKAGSMEPPTVQNPTVCAGIGSGLAPHLAFLRDRVYASEQGQTVAPFALYFGNRFVKEEFLYHQELEGYASKYDWFALHTAFSRDGKHKVYVQHLIGQTDDSRHLLLNSSDGMLYICGNRNLPKPLQDNLVKCFSNRSDDPEEIRKATIAMEDMFIHGRAQQEVW